jgi:hypothetical protein
VVFLVVEVGFGEYIEEHLMIVASFVEKALDLRRDVHSAFRVVSP